MARRVYIAGPKGTPEADAHLLALAGYAIVRGYDPVVVGVDLDAAAAIGAGGGEFWAIEVSPPQVYTPAVLAAYHEWERETKPGMGLRLRKSKTWPMWEEEMRRPFHAPVPVQVCGPDDDCPF